MIWYVETITEQLTKFGLTKNNKVDDESRLIIHIQIKIDFMVSK